MRTLSLILLLATPAYGGEIFKEVRLTDGTVIKEAQVTKVTGTLFVLTHKNGITRVPAEKLPADLRAKYEAAFEQGVPSKDEAERIAAAREKLRLEAMGIRVEMRVKEGRGFFRYHFKGIDLTGKGCTGTLKVKYELKDKDGYRWGSAKGTKFKAAPEGDGLASFDWVAGPRGPDRRTGLIGIHWTLTTNDGRCFVGFERLTGNEEGKLPPEEKRKK
jgi:hypothetical protein